MFNMKIIASCAILSLFLFSCGERNDSENVSTKDVSKETIKEGGEALPVNEFERLLNKTETAVLIDVRTPEEYAQGHIDGSMNIDVKDSNFESTIDKQDKTLTYFVYCRKGNRSNRAAEIMREKGFTVYEMTGGIETWTAVGKPITRPAMTMEQYNEKIKSSKFVMVDFTAVWCGPCKRMKPVLEEISAELEPDGFMMLEVDVDKDAPVSDALQVYEMPTYFFYKEGKQVGRLKGEMSKDDLTSYIKTLMKI